jgi:hypothetical protein
MHNLNILLTSHFFLLKMCVISYSLPTLEWQLLLILTDSIWNVVFDQNTYLPLQSIGLFFLVAEILHTKNCCFGFGPTCFFMQSC